MIVYEILLPSLKFGNFPQNLQFAKLKTSPKFSAIRYMLQVNLCEAEHPWVRPSKIEGGLSKEKRETERLFRELQGILNKLTPQKFQALAEQALKLKIDSQQRLNGCADKIIANVIL